MRCREGGIVPFPGQREYGGGSSFFGDLSLLAISETLHLFFFFFLSIHQSVVLSRFLSGGKNGQVALVTRKCKLLTPYL